MIIFSFGMLKNKSNCCESSSWKTDRKKLKENKLFKKKCYCMLRNVLSATSQSKCKRTFQMLGYSFQEFKDHIQNHPNWETIDVDKLWHLDHKLPIQAFLDHGINDIKIINALDNLQPLSQFDNNSKSDKYCKVEFQKYLTAKGKGGVK